MTPRLRDTNGAVPGPFELATRERELGADDAKTASDVGGLYLASGDILSADTFLKRAVDAFESAKERDDGDYAAALDNLASLYVAKNQASVGLQYRQRAIDVMEKAAKPNPSVLATYYRGLAEITPSLDQASKLVEKAISPGDKRAYDAGDRLNHILLLRLEGAFKDAKTLFIAPDGELNLVPFAALLDSNQDFLIRKYAFTYLSSGRELLRLGEHRPSVDGPVIFADPRYDANEGAPARAGSRGLSSEDLSRMHFPPLPGTQAEAEAVGLVAMVALRRVGRAR